MKAFTIVLPLALMCGCATDTSTPNFDARYGISLREAKLRMTINPDAGKKPDLVLGADGVSAHETMNRYYDKYKAPPPVTNVINIGGAIGSGGQ